MKGGLDVERLEQPPQPDLLKAFADREATMFGMTGTFQDLAGICPVDLNDPSVTLEAKNEFVVKAANEAGLEIEPQYQEAFNRIIEKHGLEQKYTVAEPAQAAAAENHPVIPVDRPEKNREAETQQAGLIEEQRRAVHEAYALTNQKHEAPKRAAPAAPIAAAEKIPPTPAPAVAPVRLEKTKVKPRDRAKPVLENNIHERPANLSVKELAAISTDQVVREQAVSRVEAPAAPPELAEVIPLAFSDKTESVPDQATSEPAVSVVDNVADELLTGADLFIVPPAEGAIEHLAVPQAELTIEELFESLIDIDEEPELELVTADWAAELSKEPEEVYADFVDALKAFAELAETPALYSDDESFIADINETQPAPPIVLTVAERLAELPTGDQEVVAPILKNIVGAIHGIGLLQAGEAEPEATAEALAQLEELCITLFEALGIDYSDEDIKQYIEVMLRPEFKPVQASQEELKPDLEYVGTREAKWHFPKSSSGLANPEEHIQRAVGMLALAA